MIDPSVVYAQIEKHERAAETLTSDLRARASELYRLTAPPKESQERPAWERAYRDAEAAINKLIQEHYELLKTGIEIGNGFLVTKASLDGVEARLTQLERAKVPEQLEKRIATLTEALTQEGRAKHRVFWGMAFVVLGPAFVVAAAWIWRLVA